MKIKTLFATALCCTLALGAQAQDTKQSARKKAKAEKPDTAYVFTDVVTVPVSAVENQASSGTCWSFAGIALFESDMMRRGLPEVNLSEMWIVRHTYLAKAVKAARLHSVQHFSAGANTHDVTNMLDEFGIVPQEVYDGLRYTSDTVHRHAELDNALTGYMRAIVGNRKLTPVWQDGLNGILDAYLGPIPETFTYESKQYTPQSYAQAVGLKGSDFISFTSFTHHPFYTRFALEIPDNWAWENSANVPMDEMMEIVNNALENGYAVNWSADVSEKGFRFREGFAIVPVDKVEQVVGTDMAGWTGLTKEDLEKMTEKITGPTPEKTITQEMRQEAFDNYETTDDHGMLIVGIAHDQWGNKFYKVKNSWGEIGKYKGFFYVSDAFVRYKTTNIMVHREAVPARILSRF